MKLSNLQKASCFSFYGFYKGRYKNFTVKIHEGGDDVWKKTFDHYWVSVSSKKHNKDFNSLWENLTFETVEEAKSFASRWIDEYLEKENLK